MEKIILPVIALLLCVVSQRLLVRDAEKNSYEKEMQEAPLTEISDGLKKQIRIYSVVMILLTVLIAVVTAMQIEDVQEMFQGLRTVALLSVLWPIAYSDYKTYRIPNAFVIMGIVCFFALLLPEFFVFGKGALSIMLSGIIAAVALFLAALLCGLCLKNAIGYGDVKIMIVMGLLLGLEDIWSPMFLALMASLLTAIILLITKKKSRKDSIAFGPALVAGTYLSTILMLI